MDTKIEIVIDRDSRTFTARDHLAQTEQEPQSVPVGDMPWQFEVTPVAEDASQIAVRALEHRGEAFDPSHATACSVLAIDAWITDKVFETHDDTIYVVRIVNTSTHYVAEDICIDIELDPKCHSLVKLLPDKHPFIEIQPSRQCIKCLSPGHYIDLQFVAISRGPKPGIFPVRVCISYELVYWTRARAKTHARLEIEVHDDCRPNRDPCHPPRKIPPDPGKWKPAPLPECPKSLFEFCPANEPSLEPELSLTIKPSDNKSDLLPPPTPAPVVDPALALKPQTTDEQTHTSVDPPQPTEPEQEVIENLDLPEDPPEDPDTPSKNSQVHEPIDFPTSENGEPIVLQKTNERKEDTQMSNDNYRHCHDENPPRRPPEKEKEECDEKNGCAPKCSNCDEMMPIKEDCRLPEGGILEFSYTFRKGFIARSNKGGRCVYGKRASNGELECRMESIDDTVVVMDVTNHSHFHLKHVRISGIRIFQNHEEVTTLLPSGHPVAQIVPDSVYLGSLPRGRTRWVTMSFITRGIAPGCYAIKFCVDYDIEACTVKAGINVEIKCD